MPPKKKVKKPPVKQKQKQTQSQKVIINLQDVKKTKSTRRKPVKKQQEQNIIPRGWNVYSTPDRREIDEIRGQLINVQNKLVNPKVSKNEVGREPVRYYSRDDNIGDFSNKMKFVDNEKKEQKKQQQNVLKDIRKKGEIKKQEEEQFAMFREDKETNFVNIKKVKRPRKYKKREVGEQEPEPEPDFTTITESSFI